MICKCDRDGRIVFFFFFPEVRKVIMEKEAPVDVLSKAAIGRSSAVTPPLPILYLQ